MATYPYNKEGFEEGQFLVRVKYRETYVENINIDSGYNFQSLMSEIGGIIGLFLGFCGLDLFSKCPRKGYYMAMLLLGICFIFWSVQGVQKYIQEPLSTEASTRKTDILVGSSILIIFFTLKLLKLMLFKFSSPKYFFKCNELASCTSKDPNSPFFIHYPKILTNKSIPSILK